MLVIMHSRTPRKHVETGWCGHLARHWAEWLTERKWPPESSMQLPSTPKSVKQSSYWPLGSRWLRYCVQQEAIPTGHFHSDRIGWFDHKMWNHTYPNVLKIANLYLLLSMKYLMGHWMGYSPFSRASTEFSMFYGHYSTLTKIWDDKILASII